MVLPENAGKVGGEASGGRPSLRGLVCCEGRRELTDSLIGGFAGDPDGGVDKRGRVEDRGIGCERGDTGIEGREGIVGGAR